MNTKKITYNYLLSSKSILGIMISIVGIYLAFKDFQILRFKEVLYNIEYVYVVIATLFLWLSVWLRGIRWRYLFKSGPCPSVASLYRAEMIGYFGNNILPLRFGELIRVYIIGKEWNLSKGYVLGTVILERLLDTICLFFLSFLLLAIYPIEEKLKTDIIWWGMCTLLVIIIFWGILKKIKTIQIRSKIFISLNNIIEGLLSINRQSFISIIIMSFLIWSIYLLDAYLLQCAFSFKLSFSEVLLVLVLASLAMAIPSAPGMIGTYHFAIKYVIVDLLGYTISEGTAFAIIMHAYAFVLFTLLGAYYFIKNQLYRNSIDSIT